MNAGPKYSAHTAESVATVIEHAENSQTTSQAPPTATSQQGTMNYQDTNQPRTSTAIQIPAANNKSPASAASITEAITQILTHVVDNKKDETSKQMMKNIKTFDGNK